MSSVRKKRKTELKKRAPAHSLRFNETVWGRWTALKESSSYSNHNDFATALLNKWESTQAAQELGTPVKLPTVLFSTPGTSGLTRPVIETSDISGGSESELSSEQEAAEDTLVQKYHLKAKDTDKSFLEITFEISEEEGAKKDLSYHPSPLSEEEWEDEESDMEDVDEDFSLDLTIRQDEIFVEDVSNVPLRTMSERIFGTGEDEHDHGDEEETAEISAATSADRDLVKERKAICFETEIKTLAAMKPIERCSVDGCGSSVTCSTKYVGTCVQLIWKCTQSHEVKRWDSQPRIKRVRAGDFIMSAAILCSGNNFDKLRLLFKFCGLGLLSQTTHNQIQTKHSCPVIEAQFCDMISKNREKYVGKEIVVAGDGRMDSPGHSAQYCTYTLIEYESKDILACEIIDKRMTHMKSTNMEKEGLTRALKHLLDSGILVKEICTDASTSIAALIKKDFPTLVHTYDTWHGAKNFGKKLGSVAAESKNRELRPWVPDIINHFWHCSKMADGSEDAILARWRGALHHVVNVHEWALGDSAISPHCEHEVITEDREWLEPGGTAHLALTRVMLDVRFLRTLAHFVHFRHTGELETFHEHILMYAAKRFAYKYPAYKARNYLAALDYMCHKDREVMLNKDGQPRLHRTYSKRNGTWSCYQEKVPKDYRHINGILQEIINHYVDSSVPLRTPVELQAEDPRRIKRHLAKESPPSTKILMSEKKSRFK